MPPELNFGYLYKNGAFNLLPPTKTANPIPVVAGIDSKDQVAGWYIDDTSSHGFTYVNGAYTSIDIPGALHTGITAISNSGKIDLHSIYRICQVRAP